MLKSKSKILFCIFAIAILISSVCFATGEVDLINESDDGEDAIVTADWVYSDLYLSEDNVVIDGIVDGNVFAVGKTVTIKGEVGGDVFVVADELILDGGYIYSSIFGVANSITIKGTVYDVYAVCKDFKIENGGFIYRDLRLTSQKVSIGGSIRRNAYLLTDSISFIEDEKTYIGNNLVYSSNSELSIPEGAVSGQVTYNKTEEKSFNIMSYIGTLATFLVNTLVISLLAFWLTPNFIKKVSNMGIKKSLIAIPIGLASVIALFIIFVILLVTYICVPIAFALFSLTCLLIAFSVAFSSIVISSMIVKKFNLEGKLKFILVALAVTLVIWLLELIPFVGVVIAFIMFMLGFGTVIYNLFTKVPEETNK